MDSSPKASKNKSQPLAKSDVVEDDSAEWEVEYILFSLRKNDRTYLLIKWKNYPYHQSTFVIEKDVHAPILYKQYQKSTKFEWKKAALETILGYFKSADELFIVGKFTGAPQPILVPVEDAEKKFALVQEYLENMPDKI